MKSTVIYTALIGTEDKLHDPLVKSDADYVCFTDQDVSSEVWEIRKVSSSREPVAHAKRYKMMPHWFFPEYEDSIWVDATMKATRKLKVEHEMSLYQHPVRRCAYQEAQEIMRQGLADPARVEAQMVHYRGNGFPENYGLYAGYVIYRRHNHSDVIALNEAWYLECNRWNWRDQLSLPYVIWRHNHAALFSSEEWRVGMILNSGYGEEDSDFERNPHGK